MSSNTTICPICNDAVDKLLYRFHFEAEQVVLDRIRATYPDWSAKDGICSRCIDHYQSEIVMLQKLLPEVGPHFPVKTPDDFLVLPTSLRLNAHPKYTGKGVTICFIDSGFYLHPDLIAFKNRIKAVVDVTQKRAKSYFQKPHKESWHGTMTSVVCAGDGFISKGLYKGIAYEADLVLLKVMNDEGKITTDNIVKALQWIKKHHKKYDIRIVNISLGDDVTGSYKNSEVDQLAEELIANGVIIVAAVGNDENGTIHPPANSPNVITVGGVDDGNNLVADQRLYHSTYGYTEDGLSKPEIIALAIWIAAPILPETKEQEEAAILTEALTKNDEVLVQYLQTNISKTSLDGEIFFSQNIEAIKEVITNRIQQCKYVSGWYMHVDGTSFAAPIVTSVIAQLLQINPSLDPQSVRNILFSTAKRLPYSPAIRQGFGVIQPRKAVLKTLQKETVDKKASPFINRDKNLIELYIQNHCAEEITVAGSFNNWEDSQLLMEPCSGGLWKLELPMLPKGKYHYKFFIDRKMWMEDVDNPYREPDGFSGFNSILNIEN
jgi:serine protease AprX